MSIHVSSFLVFPWFLEAGEGKQKQDLLCPEIKYIHLHFLLAPFSLLRPTSSHLVRKDVSADDFFLRASRAFIHCWALWPLPLEQKDLRLRGALNGKEAEQISGYYPWLHIRIHLDRFFKVLLAKPHIIPNQPVSLWQKREEPKKKKLVLFKSQITPMGN